MHKYLLIISIIVISACSNNKSGNSSIGYANAEEPDSAMIILKNWQSDSLGDNNFRTYENACRIIEDFDLIGKPLDSVVKYLGNNYYGTIIYDVHTPCYDNGELSDGDREMWILRVHNGVLAPEESDFELIQ